MKDLLIISPRFPPANAADAHRIRLSLPFYRALGWNPIVLTTEDERPSVNDPALAASIPADIEIIRIPVWRESATRRFGFGQLDYRCFVPLLRAGGRLIKERKIPLVFFSTTAFLSFVMGPIWKRRFGCKIVFDFQDPWYHGDPIPYTKANAPGSWRRYRLTQAIARRLEPIALRSADHILSVSQGYVDTLRRRYGFLRKTGFTLLPFPASERDYQFVETHGVTQTVFARDGREHWVYAGRGGPDMEVALSSLFAHLRDLKAADPDLASRMQVHFVGTSYAPSGRSLKSVEPLARRFGVDDLVHETSERIPYFEALALYRDCDVVLLIGSDSADYTASKLFNCVLSEKPVFAIFHKDSLVASIAGGLSCVYLTSFEAGEDRDAIKARVAAQFQRLRSEPFRRCSADQISSWLAEPSTRRQCEIFSRLVES